MIYAFADALTGQSMATCFTFAMRLFSRVFVILAAISLAGCQNVSYYSQAISGQASLLWNSKAIEQVLKHPDTTPALRARLQLVQEIRAYAVDALDLPESKSYQRYTDIGRDFVLWSVVAAREFSIAPELFCFPIVGCVSYHGYFQRSKAEEEAATLRARGLEVSVGPVAAYSTLGWFPDPVLSSVLKYPDPELAGLIFHELSHERVYIKDDTTFNESFASFVERVGVRQWLQSRGQDDALRDYQRRSDQRDRLIALIASTRERLGTVYAMDLPDPKKREQKDQLLNQLRDEYRRLRDLDEVPNWGSWFERDLNNAKLAAVGTYYDQTDYFEDLFRQAEGNFSTFYRLVEAH
ncbi:MAG: aminopeptidase [Gammaproteobacteria bacterium]|nr:aminopeptidase [Gammaproteobacteria bacterium]NDG43394.1 aminopeptidase [Gammaproteobacteria bacterium]